jgi:hypothetical protein
MFGASIGELIVVAVIVSMLAHAWRKARSRNPHRTKGFSKAFVAGMLWASAYPALTYLLRGQSPAPALDLWTERTAIAAMSAARAGIVWVAVAWVVLRARSWSRGSLLRELAVTWLCAQLLGRTVWLLESTINGVHASTLWRLFSNSFVFPHGLLGVVGAGVLTWVLHGTASATEERRFVPGIGGIRWESYGGIAMSEGINHTTRFLAASAFLQGAAFRNQILEHLDDPNRGVTPEIGIDLPLIVGVCQYADRRERHYGNVFFGLALTTIVLAAVEMPPPLILAVLALAGGAVWFMKRQQEREQIVPAFRADRFDPAAVAARYPATADHVRPDAFPSDAQNLIVYSGFSPFVGAGMDVGGWSFTVATDKVKEEFGKHSQVNPFTLRQLYGAFGEAIDRLALPDLEKRECFFVNGSDVREDRSILPHPFARPLQSLDPEVAGRYVDASDSRVRSYIWVRTQDWGGELVMSYFLRCSHRGPTLFVEIKKYLLTPLQSHLREVDTIGPERFVEKLAMALAVAPVAGLLQVLWAPFAVLGRVNAAIERWRGKDRHRRRLIESNPRYNYGSASSLRAALASGLYFHYFQRTDGDLYGKTLDREILDCLVGFLDDHNIDTSDLRQRQSTILNSGIMVQGGNVQAESLAVGQGAHANLVSGLVSRAATKAKSVATGATTS